MITKMIDFYVNLLDAVMWVVFLILFHGGRRGKPQLFLGTLVTIVGLVLNIEITGKNVLYSQCTLPLDLIILCLYTFCFLKESWYWKLSTILLYDISNFSCNSCCFSFFTNVLHISSQCLIDPDSKIRWIFLMSSKILLLFVCGEILLCKRKLVKLKKYSWFLLVLSIIDIFIISFVMKIFSFVYDERKEISSVIILMSLVVVLIFLCFYFLFESTKAWDQKLQNEALKNQISMQNEIYEKQIENIREVGRSQHDIKHKLIIVEQLLGKGDYQEAQKYTHNFLKDLEKVEKIDCKSEVWKTLLFMKQNRAQENGIHCLFDIKEHGLAKINIIDLCILLGNLMDNAIEAQEDAEGEREIYFKLREKDLIYIRVKNRNYKKINLVTGKLLTTKLNTELHGFGIEIIKEIVNKYGASCIIQV